MTPPDKTVKCPARHVESMAEIRAWITEAMDIFDRMGTGEITDPKRAAAQGYGWLRTARTKLDEIRQDLQP